MHTTNTRTRMFDFLCSEHKTPECLKAPSKHRAKANSEHQRPEWSPAIAALCRWCEGGVSHNGCSLRHAFPFETTPEAERASQAARLSDWLSKWCDEGEKSLNSIMVYCGGATARRITAGVGVSRSGSLLSSCPPCCKKALCCAPQYKSFTGFA